MMTWGVFGILLGLLLWPEPGTDSLPLNMESVIQVLTELEQEAPATEARHTAPAWLLSVQDAGPRNPLRGFLLEAPEFKAAAREPRPLSPELLSFAEEVTRHDVRDGQEYGVVLAPDGSTVAVEPLLVGLEAGLRGRRAVNLTLDSYAAVSWGAGARFPADQAESPNTVDSLLVATLAGDLGLTFLQDPQIPSQPGLGTEGCWDELSFPRNYTLLDPKPSALTMAFLNGALDGILLGDYLSQNPEPRLPLSHLLGQYYGAGVAGDQGLRSNFRRQNGATLALAPTLARQVLGALVLLQALDPAHPQLQNMSQEQLAQVATHATKEFTEAFLGCPAIHPRCRWGAAPYRGHPKPLKLPLGFLYVHHTYVPAPACTDFAHCAADMRSIQRFHQDTRGWDDIGYSFVVGSDGYVYEGRGWHWVGAHTLGHNSRGFGVAFVGNYTAALPTQAALRALRDQLPACALRAGLLRADYALLGHRQLVPTDCPGDALFGLLRTWPRFAATIKRRTARRSSRGRNRAHPSRSIPPTADLQ